MSLIWLIILGIIAYIGMQYLRTFQSMVAELRDMRLTCMNSSGNASAISNTETESIPLPMGDMKDRLVSVLSYLKTSA